MTDRYQSYSRFILAIFKQRSYFMCESNKYTEVTLKALAKDLNHNSRKEVFKMILDPKLPPSGRISKASSIISDPAYPIDKYLIYSGLGEGAKTEIIGMPILYIVLKYAAKLSNAKGNQDILRHFFEILISRRARSSVIGTGKLISSIKFNSKIIQKICIDYLIQLESGELASGNKVTTSPSKSLFKSFADLIWSSFKMA